MNNKLQPKITNASVKRFLRYKSLVVMMIPLFVLVFINGYLPLFGLIIAFKDLNYADGILNSPWAGFKNFEFLFNSGSMWGILRNTFAYNIVFIFLGLVLAVMVAILINEMRSKLASKIYQTMMILPNFLSMVVVSYVVYALLNYDYGFFNNIITYFGGEKIDWYTSPEYWPWILIITRMWHNVGYGSIVYMAALAGVDQGLYEAAYLDGANKWQQIWYVSVPMLKPVMSIMMILSLGGIIKGDFGLFYLVPMASPPLIPVTDIVDTYVYRSLITLNDIGMSSATGFFQSVVGCIMLVGANLIIRKIDKEQSLF